MAKKSDQLFERAKKVIPGGVNSPIRAFKALNGTPHFIETGLGSRFFDADKLQLIDCIGAWGAMILGHAHRYVVEAVKKAAVRGFAYGAPTESEIELAEMIVGAVPSVEMVRLVNSGTEATLSAIRLARGITGRSKILKFDGCYYGHLDSLLLKSSDGDDMRGLPDSAGIPPEFAELAVSIPFNDPEQVDRAFDRFGEQLAGVIVEPVAGNMGCVPPEPGFLEKLRSVCDGKNTLLIFDESTTGFRVSWGGAQELYGVRPDLTILGKIIGGGLPIGAYGGRNDLMSHVAPVGDVYQAGTLSGNGLSVAAGISTLSILKNGPVYRDLEQRSKEFEETVLKLAENYRIPIRLNRVGSMWTIFFAEDPVTNLVGARKSNLEFFDRFFQLMLGEGVHLPSSQFESAFFSSAHARKDIQQICERINLVFKRMSKEFEDDLMRW